MDISIRYDLGQHGWASFTLSAGEHTVEVGAFGYCTDALGDLVRAALLIATGASRAEARFDGEPKEWRLIVTDPNKETCHFLGPAERPLRPLDVSLRLLAFPDFGRSRPEAEGKALLDISIGPHAFACAVQQAAQAVWDRHGPEGYDAAWCGTNGFPSRALKALATALAHQDPFTASLA